MNPPNLGQGRLLATAFEQQRLPISVQIVIDWRTQGYIGRVKDQKKCGACWAFTTVPTIEFLYNRRYGKKRDFSEQHLVDCSGAYYNYGCSGGWFESSYYFVMLHGVLLESQYPYTAS